MTDIPKDVLVDIKEFIRLDDGLKDSRIEMKERREEMAEHKESIIDYMKSHDMDKLPLEVGKIEQCLYLQEKEHKIRPDGKLVQQKLQEMIAQGITDPEKIYEEINSCGGVKSVWSLARRSKVVRKSKPKK